MKKAMCLLMVIVCCFTIVVPAFASEPQQLNENTYPYLSELPEGEIYTYTENGVTYEYIHYANPVDYEYDGETQTLLGRLVVHEPSAEVASTFAIGDNQLTTIYDIVDEGIVSYFVDMSNPYFIASVAKGETISSSISKSVTISVNAKIEADIPSGAVDLVKSTFKADFSISASGSYTTTFSVTLTGPGESSTYNTRTFYYKTGYHKHAIKLYVHHYSSWTGIYATDILDTFGYEPTYQQYSIDSTIEE